MRINMHLTLTGDVDDADDMVPVVQEVVAAIRAKYALVRWTSNLHATTTERFDAKLAKLQKEGKW